MSQDALEANQCRSRIHDDDDADDVDDDDEHRRRRRGRQRNHIEVL